MSFPADVNKIKKIAKINNLKLIHDAAQSLGANIIIKIWI